MKPETFSTSQVAKLAGVSLRQLQMWKQETFSTSQVSKLAGVSLRQLQTWDQNALLRSNQSEDGRRWRIYSVRQVMQVMVIKEFRRRGIMPSRMCSVLRFIRTRPMERFLITTLSEHSMAETATAAVDFMLRQSRPAIILDLAWLGAKIREGGSQ